MKFDFTAREYKYLKNELMLTKEDELIFEMKTRGYSIKQIALELHIGEATVSRHYNKIMKKIVRVLLR